MDELTLLRKVRNDVADPTAEALTAGRAALFNTIQGVEPARRPRRRGVKIAGLSALSAGVLTIALVATNVVGFAGWRGGAEPAAAEALHSAALATIKSSDPVVAPGQYLQVATSAVYSATGTIDSDRRASYLFIVKEELYLPADRNDDWVWVRHPSDIYQTFGADSEEFAEASSNQRREVKDELLQAPAGEFYGGEASSGYGDLDGLPRDPAQLLNQIYVNTVGQGQSPDDAALVFIADRLSAGVVPADLRAAFYNAAALIPGVTITENQATLDGRTGVAIGREEGERQEIIIDPETGMYIGERRVTLSGFDGIPAGTVVSWSAVTTSVVDAAPGGGTVNGIFDEMGCVSDGEGGAQCPTEN